MSLTDTQLPKQFREVCDEQLEIHGKGCSIQVRNTIPDTGEIPLDDKRHWLRIPDVICVFVDMTGSTTLSATTADRETAGAYQLFSDTAVRLFDKFDAPYIEVQGDGVFALFNSDQPYRALAAAVSFKTFVTEEFKPRMKKATALELECHAGIDRKTVLVKKLGLRKYGNRTDRQNEVWAGKPVNMSAKLSGLAGPGELLASDRYYARITHDKARKTCGCPHGVKKALWSEIDVTDDSRFDFTKSYKLVSKWCTIHGAEYCDAVLALD
jgi:class 3 adenylate cyclase